MRHKARGLALNDLFHNLLKKKLMEGLEVKRGQEDEDEKKKKAKAAQQQPDKEPEKKEDTEDSPAGGAESHGEKPAARVVGISITKLASDDRELKAKRKAQQQPIDNPEPERHRKRKKRRR